MTLDLSCDTKSISNKRNIGKLVFVETEKFWTSEDVMMTVRREAEQDGRNCFPSHI